MKMKLVLCVTALLVLYGCSTAPQKLNHVPYSFILACSENTGRTMISPITQDLVWTMDDLHDGKIRIAVGTMKKNYLGPITVETEGQYPFQVGSHEYVLKVLGLGITMDEAIRIADTDRLIGGSKSPDHQVPGKFGLYRIEPVPEKNYP